MVTMLPSRKLSVQTRAEHIGLRGGGELSILIVLIPHIVTEREIHTLGSLCNAENRLSLLQGKRDFRHHRLLWRLSPEALPENHHRQDIQGRQGNNQHDTRLHRHAPSSMV